MTWRTSSCRPCSLSRHDSFARARTVFYVPDLDLQHPLTKFSADDLIAECDRAKDLHSQRRFASRREDAVSFQEDLADAEREVRDVLVASGDLRNLGRLSAKQAATLLRFFVTPALSEDDFQLQVEYLSREGRPLATVPVAQRPQAYFTGLLSEVGLCDPLLADGALDDATCREALVARTAHQLTSQRQQTRRRNSFSREVEDDVVGLLRECGFAPRPTTGDIIKVEDLPVGTYAGRDVHVAAGRKKCDGAVRLTDGHLVAIEAKVSSSATNSVKRVVNDCMSKYEDWVQAFGTENFTMVVVFAGVMPNTSASTIQGYPGLFLVFHHDLEPLRSFLTGRTPEPGAEAPFVPPVGVPNAQMDLFADL